METSNSKSEPATERCDIASRNRYSNSWLRVWQAVVLFVVLGVIPPIALRVGYFGSASPTFIAIVAFTWINFMIALWEIAMHVRIRLIERQSAQFLHEYSGNELRRVLEFFNARITLRDVFKPDTWAEVWSSYSLFDSAYADSRSFGFWVDSGNGFSTIIPSLVFIYGLALQVLDPRILGILGIIIFWQMLYGTVIYFWAYIYRRQYVGHKLSNLIAFIAGANGLWMIFPIWALWVCGTLIMEQSYAVIG